MAMPSNTTSNSESSSSDSTSQDKPTQSTNTSQPTSPVNAHTIRPLARERPYAREEYNTSTSKPPSVRSGTSYGRTLNRLMTGHHTRHHSNYSSFSTISENVLPWTTQDIGFNAISGVLNDPVKRSQDTYKPTKADIPPVPHVSIPRIKPSDFEAYLNHIGPAFEQYHHNKLLNKDSTTTVVTVEEEEEETEDGRQGSKRTGRNPYSLPQHILSSESLLDDESKTPPRELPMLENVPAIFFEPEFLLENPQVFDMVCEGADVVENSGPVLTILQEKLSYYLDTVEIHLLREIENRSSSFFEALSNLQALHQQTVDCISQIHTIRQKMKRMQETECKDGLEVIRLQVRKRNLEKLHHVTEAVKNVKLVQPTIQALLSKGDYFAALDLIEDTKRVLEDKELRAIKALANYSSELDEMQKSVGVMMQHDFLGLILSDFSYVIESEREKDEWTTQSASGEMSVEKELQGKLIKDIKGLIRTDALIPTLQNYGERLIVETKDRIRKRYPAAETEIPEQSLAKQLKTMPFVSFFQVLLDILSILIQSIQRASIYHKLFIQTIENVPEIEKELTDIMLSIVDLAHAQCGKLIGSRSEQNALLNPTDFYRLSNILNLFVIKSENYCGQPCIGLRSILTNQQKLFLDHFHMERVKQEAQLIENEQWAVSEVPSEFQLITNQLCEGNMAGLLEERQNEHSDHEKGSKKHLMFQDYIKCILNLENILVVQKLLELLKLFNSRVCQVILGAGAMQSAGLKNITAKHLALASQSIGVMVVLVPKLKECMESYVSSKQANLLSEFDRIVNDYTNHQNEIHTKLVAIMNERFTAHVKAMQSIQWDEEEKEGVVGKHANVYMETLVTETIRLHKVLSKYLPIDDLKFIMSKVFDSFTTQFSKEISTMDIKTDKGKDRLIKDINFFMHRLKSLQHVDPPSDSIIEAVNAITLNA
ncbi:hypothetical protein G6F57_004640 [Rhizopus arrhizus]|nr:hypothetical protein G6F30_005927 [Rhizopus arrhizus]KAG1410528.1 hypothetical protein G6F58_009078 [Rhizopus delemar]KAG0986879.1 hypothetical protein G6F29_002932 [Rhizopus arrhizus]KAG0994602.1 hypothetical protein G6F28_005583 [Rhizopus arrhizus]KAG1013703.1 hypothetical protein G6F27_001637 [Rhizopus arrhizus]